MKCCSSSKVVFKKTLKWYYLCCCFEAVRKTEDTCPEAVFYTAKELPQAEIPGTISKKKKVIKDISNTNYSKKIPVRETLVNLTCFFIPLNGFRNVDLV